MTLAKKSAIFMHFCIFLADFLLSLFTLSMPANETNGISCRIMNEIRNAALKNREGDEEKNAYPNQIRG